MDLARTYGSLDLGDVGPLLSSPQTQLFAMGGKKKTKRKPGQVLKLCFK